MIIQSLHEYYERLSNDPQSGVAPVGYSKAKVAFVFNLSANGELLDIFPLYEIKEKNKVAKDVLVPEQVIRTSGVNANFLCDNSSYVLGVDNKGNKQRTKECFTTFKELHNKILIGVMDEGAKAVLGFLNSREPGQISEKAVQDNMEQLLEGGNIVFKFERNWGVVLANDDFNLESEEVEVLVLIDEDGIEHHFELIAEMEIEDQMYVVVAPLEEDEEDEDYEDDEEGLVLIFKALYDDEDNLFLSDIEDDEEWARVKQAWEELIEGEEFQ